MSHRLCGDEPDRARAHAAQARVLLQHEEQLEQRGRMAREYVVRDGLQAVVTLLEMAGERQRRGVAVGGDLLAELLQQQLVEPGDLHRRAVVALHELLDGERVGRVLVAEHPREANLVVEQQAVLAPPAHEVQREAHPPQPGLRGFQLRELARRQEAGPGEFAERLDAEVALGHPGDRLDVAQSRRDPA